MIEAEAVTKRFGSVVAVNEVRFTLERGETVGFIGPNGAGKSTVLRMLATYLYPTSGRLRIDGVDVVADPLRVRRRIGYLPGETPLYFEMRADRFLEFMGRAHGLRGRILTDRLTWVVENCGLEAALGKRIKACSTGYRKRLGLAAALIHDPEIVLLDEPTHGLDPLQIRTFRKIVAGLQPERIILLSSHVISEVTRMCDRTLIIHEGRILADGPLDALCAEHGVEQGELEELFVQLVRREPSDPRNAGAPAGAQR